MKLTFLFTKLGWWEDSSRNLRWLSQTGTWLLQPPVEAPHPSPIMQTSNVRNSNLPLSSWGNKTLVRIWRPVAGSTSTCTGTLGFDWFGLIQSASSWVRLRRVIGRKGILKYLEVEGNLKKLTKTPFTADTKLIKSPTSDLILFSWKALTFATE